MPDVTHLIVLRLEGILQSWGENSKWNHRGTAEFPTKSGIVGLIACAMGLERDSMEIESLAGNIRIAIRADRLGSRFTDYQTVTGNPLYNAKGKDRSVGNTIITPREYLQNACFTVFIETSDKIRETITAAFMDPKWCIYLGRKSCVPSRPVLECVCYDAETLADAVRNYPVAEEAEYPMPWETESRNEEMPALKRMDAICGNSRQFQMRSVWRSTIKEGENVPDSD